METSITGSMPIDIEFPRMHVKETCIQGVLKGWDLPGDTITFLSFSLPG